MKRLVMCFAIVCAIALIFTVADLKAATSQNIWITVSIAGTNSIVVINGLVPGSTNWSVTNVPFGFITNRQVSTVISNDGLITETLGLQLDCLASGWTNSTAIGAGIDVYELTGIFATNGSSQPLVGDYILDDVITVTPTDSDNTTVTFGQDAANNGYGILPAEIRELWLKLKVPTGGIVGPAKPTMRLIISSTAL